MIRSNGLDPAFVAEIMAEPGGENLLECWSCGTCTATCLVRRFDPSFNPRVTLHKVLLGLREEVLSSSEIWQCSACDACYTRCPKQIHISEVMKAIRAVAIRSGYESPGPIPTVDEDMCSGCAVCTRACPYEAMDRVTVASDGSSRLVARAERNLCLRCGLCVAACPSEAIALEELSDRDILIRAAADGWLERKGFLQGGAQEPRILAFICQWSLRSDEEYQRLERFGERVRVVNVPCSGRVPPELMLLALSRGADGVLVVGCREGECHFQRGTYQGRARVRLLEAMLNDFGIAPHRLRFAELGAFDRYVLPGLVTAMSEDIAATVPIIS